MSTSSEQLPTDLQNVLSNPMSDAQKETLKKNCFKDLKIEINAQMQKTTPTNCCIKTLCSKLLRMDVDLVTLFTTGLTFQFSRTVNFKAVRMLYSACNPKPTDEQIKTVVINLISQDYSIVGWINSCPNYDWGCGILMDVNFDWLKQPSFTQDLLTSFLKIHEDCISYFKSKFDQMVKMFYETKDDDTINRWIPILCAEINRLTNYEKFPKGEDRKQSIRKTVLMNQFNCLVTSFSSKTNMFHNLFDEQTKLKRQLQQSDIVTLRSENHMYKLLVSNLGIDVVKKRLSASSGSSSKRQKFDPNNEQDREFLTMYS